MPRTVLFHCIEIKFIIEMVGILVVVIVAAAAVTYCAVTTVN